MDLSKFKILGVIALMALSACGKKLPEKVPDDVKAKALTVSSFDQEVTLNFSSGTKNVSAVTQGQIFAVKRNQYEPVSFHSGPGELARFFQELELPVGKERSLKVKFKLTPNYLVAFSGGRPIFQFKVSSYGRLQKKTNDFGEETREIEYVETAKSQATHLKIDHNPALRILGDMRGLKPSVKENLLDIKILHNKILNSNQLRGLRAPDVLLSKTVMAKIVDHHLYLLEAKNRDQLNSFEKSALKQNLRDPRLVDCDRKVKALSNLNQCVLIATHRLKIIPVAIKYEKNIYGDILASLLVSPLNSFVSFSFSLLNLGEKWEGYKLGQETKLDKNIYFSKKELETKVFTKAELLSLLAGYNIDLKLGKLAGPFKVKILGQKLFVLEQKSGSGIGRLIGKLEGADHRIEKCESGDCHFVPVREISISFVKLEKRPTHDGSTGSIEGQTGVSSQFSDLISMEQHKVFKEVKLFENLNLADKDLMQLGEDIDLSREYLYVPSTLGTPRLVKAADPFYQGNEKIVKMYKVEEGIRVYEVEKDGRFIENPMNQSPVLTIPGKFVDFRCQKDGNGECSGGVEYDNTQSWKDKKFFIPNLDRLIVHEINTLNLFTVAEGCINETGNKIVSKEVKKGVINLEVERTFQVSPQSNCIVRLFYDDNLSSASFKVRYFYSVVGLDLLASANYKPVQYPLTEHGKFGFFKSKKKKLNDQFEPGRENIEYFVNRFNPDKKEIVFYLSDTFKKDENQILKEATFNAVETVNRSLKHSHVDMKIVLKQGHGRKAGDLRNNMIVLIDEPLANGLLGYGPSVANPRTGEIVQAHTNMYSGVLKTLMRRVYQQMVDLNLKLKKSQPVVPAIAAKPTSLAVAIAHQSKELHELGEEVRPLSKMELSKVDQRRIRQKRADHHHHHHHHHGPGVKNILKMQTAFEKRMHHYAKNNAFPIEAMQVGALAKKMIPGIAKISGISNSSGKLKSWRFLTNEQKTAVENIILPRIYTATLVHELGHNLGLRHNFAGSHDGKNFYSEKEAQDLGLHYQPHYSSIMDYAFSELNELAVFGKYDEAALRFAYGRKVQDEKGKVYPLSTTLTAFEKANPKVKLKKYTFCTDENAGTSITCQRFDEGTNYEEIVKHYVNNYFNKYQYRNRRDGRLQFSKWEMDQYILRRYFEFSRIRAVYEDYEFFESIAGERIMTMGCPDPIKAQYPDFCKRVEDLNKATELAGKFFIHLASAPDHLCAIMDDKTKKLARVDKLADLFDKIKWDINYVPASCFDPAIVAHLKKDSTGPKTPVAQAGRYFNDVKGTGPLSQYRTDIDVRGVWADKLLALWNLTNRYTFTTVTEDFKGSLIDHPNIKPLALNLFSHMITGEKLKSAHPFVLATGQMVPLPYSIGDDYQIEEQITPLAIGAFNLPALDKARLAPTMLNMAFNLNQTEDPKMKDKAESLVKSLGVYKLDPMNKVNSRGALRKVVKDTLYVAKKENVLAYGVLLKSRQLDQLKKGPKKSVEKVLKYKVDLVKGLSANEKKVFDLGEGLARQLVPLKRAGRVLDLKFLVQNFGHKLGTAIFEAYKSSVTEMEKAVSVMDKLKKVPNKFTKFEKKIFKMSNQVAMDFLSGKLEKMVAGQLDRLEYLAKISKI